MVQNNCVQEEALGLISLLLGSSGPLLLQWCEWFV